MTTRRRRPNKAVDQQLESELAIISNPTQAEIEHFFTDPTPEEIKEVEKIAEKKRVRPAKTGKVFLGEEDIRHFEAYKKFLKEEQGIKNINHKPI